MRVVKVPGRIAFACAAPELFRCYRRNTPASVVEVTKVVHCFIPGPNSHSVAAPFQNWANNLKTFFCQPGNVVEAQVEDNNPRKLRLVSLETVHDVARFTVVDQSLRLFTISQDVFTEAMLAGGYDENGTLGGEYIFAIVDERIQLIRVGSRLHSELLKIQTCTLKSMVCARMRALLGRNKPKQTVPSRIRLTHISEFDIPWSRK